MSNTTFELSAAFSHFFLDRFVVAFYIGLSDYSVKAIKRSEYLDAHYPIDDNFLSAVTGYIENDVHPDDREALTLVLQPDYIRDRLKDADYFSYMFRDISEETEKFYRFYAFRGDDDNYAVTCLIDITKDVQKSYKEKEEAEQRKVRDIIDVLSSEYNAVYYCNEDTHDYDILFQQGFVKEELVQLKQLCPLYEQGFNYYIDNLVHPDDRETMRRELSNVPKLLQSRKSVRIEFRRLYGERYLYSEMYVVKIGEAKDSLHAFVAGFAENDETYRNKVDQQKQLESLIFERTAELENKNKTLNRINEQVIELLGNITEARDVESGEHIRRVKGYTNILANQMMKDWPEYGLTPDIVDLMTSASALHDIGKISIPDAILLKPGRLTPDEFEIMKTHCIKGCEILRKAPEDWSSSYLKISMDICHYHHERFDGRGYPEKLIGDEIPIAAQIVAVADCFDALSSKRCYKDAYGLNTAFEMILNGECGCFSDKIYSSLRACRVDIFNHASDFKSEYHSNMPAGLSNSSLSNINLLLVDDNGINRDLAQDVLEGEGASVELASGGQEAIDMFLASEPGRYDAILMDVFMPDMNGTDAARNIRMIDRADAKTIPIIALTSLTSDEDVNVCLSSGMDSFLTKPISVQSLNRVLYQCMSKSSESLQMAVDKAEKNSGKKVDQALQKYFTVSGVNQTYALACIINGKNNTISGLRMDKSLQNAFDQTNPKLPANKRFDQMFKNLIRAKDFPKFINDNERYRVTEILANSEYYYSFVNLIIDGEDKLYRLRFQTDDENNDVIVLIMQNVSEEARDEERSRSLLNILSDSYLVIDHLDLQEDRFTRFHGTTRNKESVSFEGCFSEITEEYIKECVVPEDRDTLAAFLDRDSLRKVLRNKKTVATRYRSVSTGVERFTEIIIINTSEESDARFALLTLSDVDEITRNELKNLELLEAKYSNTTIDDDIRDPLTGVKNSNAYSVTVDSLSTSIRENKDTEFAIVLCEIKDLCLINETYGMEIGDAYIRNCCDIITNVYALSPVFRLGGDRFAVVLTGVDYRNRYDQFDRLNLRMEDASHNIDVEHGKASFASGMAVFDPRQDLNVSDVYKRASNELSEHLKLMI